MERYAKQVKFIGRRMQKEVCNTTACIVGVGALGTVAADLLARAGMNLVLIDDDVVQLDNLQRQSLFSEKDIGRNKAEAAKGKLQEINSEIRISAMEVRLTADNVSLIGNPGIILVCTDNMESKSLINDYMHMKMKCIFGSAAGSKGIVYSYQPGKPCFRCIFGSKIGDTANTIGILNSLTHIVGSMMANEAIKSIIGKPEDGLLQIDVMANTLDKIKVRKTCGRCLS